MAITHVYQALAEPPVCPPALPVPGMAWNVPPNPPPFLNTRLIITNDAGSWPVALPTLVLPSDAAALEWNTPDLPPRYLNRRLPLRQPVQPIEAVAQFDVPGQGWDVPPGPPPHPTPQLAPREHAVMILEPSAFLQPPQSWASDSITPPRPRRFAVGDVTAQALNTSLAAGVFVFDLPAYPPPPITSACTAAHGQTVEPQEPSLRQAPPGHAWNVQPNPPPTLNRRPVLRDAFTRSLDVGILGLLETIAWDVTPVRPRPPRRLANYEPLVKALQIFLTEPATVDCWHRDPTLAPPVHKLPRREGAVFVGSPDDVALSLDKWFQLGKLPSPAQRPAPRGGSVAPPDAPNVVYLGWLVGDLLPPAPCRLPTANRQLETVLVQFPTSYAPTSDTWDRETTRPPRARPPQRRPDAAFVFAPDGQVITIDQWSGSARQPVPTRPARPIGDTIAPPDVPNVVYLGWEVNSGHAMSTSKRLTPADTVFVPIVVCCDWLTPPPAPVRATRKPVNPETAFTFFEQITIHWLAGEIRPPRLTADSCRLPTADWFPDPSLVTAPPALSWFTPAVPAPRIRPTLCRDASEFVFVRFAPLVIGYAAVGQVFVVGAAAGQVFAPHAQNGQEFTPHAAAGEL